jgi:hypothetical protein
MTENSVLIVVLGAMKPGDMITGKITLENMVEDGFKTLISDKDGHVNILVQI